MSDTQLMTLVVTLLAIFGAIYMNRKSAEDMRDVLRSEMKAQMTEFKAELKTEMTGLKTDLKTEMSGVNNKLDHLLEVVAKHDEKLG